MNNFGNRVGANQGANQSANRGNMRSFNPPASNGTSAGAERPGCAGSASRADTVR